MLLVLFKPSLLSILVQLLRVPFFDPAQHFVSFNFGHVVGMEPCRKRLTFIIDPLFRYFAFGIKGLSIKNCWRFQKQKVVLQIESIVRFMAILEGSLAIGTVGGTTIGAGDETGACWTVDTALTLCTLLNSSVPSMTEQPAGVSIRLMTMAPLLDLAALLSFIISVYILRYQLQIAQPYFDLQRIMEERSDWDRKAIEYDAIFVGQLGVIVANIVLKSDSKVNHKFLIINSSKQIIQPALLPVQSPIVDIKKDFLKACDIDHEEILKIYPEESLIVMQNKKWYRYRYLVHTENVEEWSDFSVIENLHEALRTKYSFVYSNVLKSDPKLSSAEIIFQRFKTLKRLERKRASIASNENRKGKDQHLETMSQGSQRLIYSESQFNFIFYIPNPPHSGYDNLNIFYKFDEFMEYFDGLRKKVRQEKDPNEQEEEIQLNFILLLEGNCVYPYCPAIDALVKQKIEEKGIKILRNHKIEKIDYLRRKIVVLHSEDESQQEGPKQVSISIKNTLKFCFDYLHVVLKQKMTHLLSASGLNPFRNYPRTLLNSKYDNVFIFGADLFPTTHSFEAINHQAHKISQTLSRFLKTNRILNNSPECDPFQYSGYSAFRLWIDQKTFLKLQHEYEDLKKKQSIDERQRRVAMIKKKYNKEREGCCFSFFQKTKGKLLFPIQVEFYYNLKSYGSPFYFFLPENSQKSQ